MLPAEPRGQDTADVRGGVGQRADRERHRLAGGRDAPAGMLGLFEQHGGFRVQRVSGGSRRHSRTRKWTTAAPLPTPPSAGAAVVVAGWIVHTGGECTAPVGSDGAATIGDVTAYHPGRNHWTAFPALPQGRHAFGAGWVGGRGYFIGGTLTCGGGASADTLELADQVTTRSVVATVPAA